MTLQQNLGVGWGWGGFPLFPEMEFRLLCFSLFHRIVEIDWMVKFSSSGDICIWRYMQTTLSLIGENIQQLYLK